MDIARRPLDIVAVVAGAAVFAVCAVIASSGTVGATERSVFRAINTLPEALSPIMTKVQILGVLAIGPLVALGAAIARRWRLALAALIVTGLKLLGERIVWYVLDIHRERPGVTEPEAIVRGSTPLTGVSFVSGHVILTTGLAWVLTPWLPPKWRWVPWVIAALVAFARVYLGAHNPLDVLGGFAIGCMVGGIALLITGVPASS
jgi:membrane-associated phospholipid phosphatase